MERSLGLLIVKREPASTQERFAESFVLCHGLRGQYGPLQVLRPITGIDEMKCTVATNSSYDLFEIWADFDFYDENAKRPYNLYVDAHNAEIVRKLLPQNAAIAIKTKFRIKNEDYFHFMTRYSALGSKNTLNVLEKIITSGAIIKYRHPKGGTLAHLAAERGNADMIGMLVRHGIDLNETRSDGCTPFLLALMNGNLDAVKALIENGASLNEKMADGSTALHFAVKSKLQEIVKLLLEKGFDVNSRAARGCTPLHLAITAKLPEVVGMLLEKGADVNAKGASGCTPLHLAIKAKMPELVETLMEKGADVNAKEANGCTTLHLAIESKMPDVVETLLKKGVDVNAKTKKGWTPLHAAAECCDYHDEKIIMMLLKEEVEIDPIGSNGKDTEGMTPLLVAQKNKTWLTALRLMKNGGANPKAVDAHGRNVLYFAVLWSDDAVINYLLRLELDVNSPENKRAFYLAFRIEDFVDISVRIKWSKAYGHNETAGHTSVVEDFIEYGFSVGPEEACVPDVLYGAIRKGFFWIVKRLVTYGADLNQKHLYELVEWGGNTPQRPAFLKHETTPLHVACRYAPTKIVKFLLEHGANPTVGCGPDNTFTPIAAAVDSGNSNIVDLMVSKGIVVHDRPELLRSALKMRNHNVVEVLLENGCAVDWTEEKALAHVIPRDCLSCLHVLMKYGAPFNFRDIILDKEYHDNDLYYATVISPNFLRSLLAYGFIDLDLPTETFLIKLLNKCALKPERESDNESGSGDDSERGEFDEERNCTKDKLGKIILKHVASLKAAGKTVGKVLDQFDNILNFDTLLQSCKEEIEAMKNKFIDGTNISLFDVLMRDTVPRWFRRKGFRTAFYDCFDENEFPLYGCIINCHADQALWKYKFFMKGLKGFNKLTVRLPILPYDVKMRIIDLLDRRDLINLDVCFKPKKSKIEGHSNLDMLDCDETMFSC